MTRPFRYALATATTPMANRASAAAPQPQSCQIEPRHSGEAGPYTKQLPSALRGGVGAGVENGVADVGVTVPAGGVSLGGAGVSVWASVGARTNKVSETVRTVKSMERASLMLREYTASSANILRKSQTEEYWTIISTNPGLRAASSENALLFVHRPVLLQTETVFLGRRNRCFQSLSLEPPIAGIPELSNRSFVHILAGKCNVLVLNYVVRLQRLDITRRPAIDLTRCPAGLVHACGAVDLDWSGDCRYAVGHRWPIVWESM